MDIVIRIRDTSYDGRDESPLDYLPAAEAAVASVKLNRPIDDGVSLVDISIEPDPERTPRRKNKPYVDVAARDAAEAAEAEEARIARSEEQDEQAVADAEEAAYQRQVADANRADEAAQVATSLDYDAAVDEAFAEPEPVDEVKVEQDADVRAALAEADRSDEIDEK